MGRQWGGGVGQVGEQRCLALHVGGRLATRSFIGSGERALFDPCISPLSQISAARCLFIVHVLPSITVTYVTH